MKNILLNLANRIAALERADAQKISLGRISDVDLAQAKARVEIADGVRTPLLPWLVPAVCSERVSWSAPTVGEVVLVLLRNEFCSGVILRGLYSDAVPAPEKSATKHSQTFSDGAEILYDTATHTLSATLPDSSTAILDASEIFATCKNATLDAEKTIAATAGTSATLTAPSVTIDADKTEITGELSVGGNIIGGGTITDGYGKILNAHTHGNGNNGSPTTPPL